MDTDTVIIGAGQAGLAAPHQLRARGIEPTLLDAGPRVGASWDNRWDSLRQLTPVQYDGLPGSPFPGEPDTYPGKADVAAYLRSYATQWDIGLPWQHDRGSALLGFVGRGAARLADRLVAALH